MFDVDKIRSDFPMIGKEYNDNTLIYFDSAATAQKPQVVIDTICDFYENHYGTVHRAVYQLSLDATDRYLRVRRMVKNFINAPSEDCIVYTKGTTDGINLVASGLGRAFFSEGDEIIVSQIEHHSNLLPWRMLCQERNLVLRVIPVDNSGEIIFSEYEKLLSSRTKLVSVAHISNSIGTILPIKKIIRKAKEYGALTLIDAAQSVAHVPIDVQDLDADFLVFSGHKVYGPTGVGILFGKKELLDKLPPYQSGGDMVANVWTNSIEYSKPPVKFEAGTPMIAEVIGLGAAINYLSEVGLDVIHKHEDALTRAAYIGLKEVPGVRIFGPGLESRGGIISFMVDNVHAMDIGAMLDAKGIAVRTGQHCSQPTMDRFGCPSMVRVSFGMYNTFEEVEYFLASIKQVISICT